MHSTPSNPEAPKTIPMVSLAVSIGGGDEVSAFCVVGVVVGAEVGFAVEGTAVGIIVGTAVGAMTTLT